MLASIIIPTPTRTIQIWKHDYLVHSFHLENSHGRENFAGRGNSDGGRGGGHSSLSSLAVALPPPIRKIIEAVVTQILRLVQFVKCATRQDIRHQIAIIGMIILIPVTPPICMHCLQLRRSPRISTVSRFRCKSPSCS